MRKRSLALTLALLGILAFAPALGSGATSKVTGGGWFLFAGSIPMQFGFSGVRHAPGPIR